MLSKNIGHKPKPHQDPQPSNILTLGLEYTGGGLNHPP